MKDIKVEFPDRTVFLHVAEYVFASVARLMEQENIIEAYRSLGLSCARLISNRYGELARELQVDGHPCVVWAEEYPPEEQIDAWKNQKCKEDGRFPFHNELLTVMAKIGAMHIAGNQPNYAFSPEEMAAAPLIYKNLLLGVTYYYCDIFFHEEKPDAATAEKLLDLILLRLRRGEIDFASLLGK